MSGEPMSGESPVRWVGICALEDLVPELGVAALLDATQIALFRLADDSVHAVQQSDPYADGANVMSRGIVGTVGDRDTVASPLHKQVFDVRTGECLDPKGDPAWSLETWPVRVRDGVVEVGRAQ